MRIASLVMAIAMALPVTMAVAQDMDPAAMAEDLTMIEQNAASAFSEYGIEADPMALTLAQLSEIVAILNDPDANSGGKSAKMSIEAALRRE